MTAYLLSDEAITDNIPIVIGGTAGSVVLGASTEIASVYDDTAYQFRVSVIVADTNGNPINAAQVSLSLWPTQFAVSDVIERYDSSTGVTEYENILTWTDNEDINRNTYLDPGEDLGFPNGQLDPGNSAGGTIPASVITDEYGVATFTWTYLKIYGRWLSIDLTASTYVLGSETSTALNIVLPVSQEDMNEGVLDPFSPWIASYIYREVGDVPDLYGIYTRYDAAVGAELTFVANAHDLDDDVLTFSLDDASVALGMTIDPVTGQFSWTPTEDQVGEYPVTVTVTDDSIFEYTDTYTTTIIVELGSPPNLYNIYNHNTVVGTLLTFVAEAYDSDGDMLAFSLDDASVALGMTIDSVTGQFSWTPTEDQVGEHTVTVYVTDDSVFEYVDSDTITITVAAL